MCKYKLNMVGLDQRDPDQHYFVTEPDCSYYDVKSFNSKFERDEKSLRLFHLNVRSVVKNGDELFTFLKSLAVEFHVILLTETWLDDASEFFNVPGYTAYHSVRSERRGGGVSVLVRDHIQSEVLPKYTLISDLFEMCSVSLTINKKKYNIIGVYRPPSCSQNDFNTSFFSFVNDNSLNKSFTTFLGDFNIDLCAPSLLDITESYKSEFYCLHYLSIISLPTRIQNDSVTLLDQIWTNSLMPCSSGVFPVHLSDHYPIFVCIKNVFSRESQLIKTKFRSHNVSNVNSFKEKVGSVVNEFRLLDEPDVDVRWRNFCSLLYEAYNKTCPIKNKTISVKRANSPWLTNKLLECVDRKHELYRLSLEDVKYVKPFKKYRNVLTTCIRDAKSKYFHDKFESCTSDIKKTWNSINGILQSGKRQTSTMEMLVDDVLVSDPIMIATKFNEHYTTIAGKLANNIPLTNVDPAHNVDNITNSFMFQPTDSIEIDRTINSFKSKQSHLYTIPSFMYKHVSAIISSLVSDLINESFYKGIFPDVLKVARVIPIFKAGQKVILSNYRPISTLDFLSKVYERVIYNRLINFFTKFNIICVEQFGFLRKLSTGDAILRFTDNIYNSLEKGNYLISVLLDFSKAFDTVDHEILLNKLTKLGIRDFSLQWIRSYLFNRKQYVSINGSDSPLLPITVGVPQGSILGPLLFLIYINDMSKCSNVLSFVHFADDTTVFVEGNNLEDLHLVMNRELEKVDAWLCANKLSLNINKTSFMIHGNRSKATNSILSIRNVNLTRVNQAKFLGVIVDDGLKFKDHIAYICGKISKSSGIMRRLSGVVPSHVLKKIYLALVYPYLVYAVESWGSSSKTMLGKLGKIQNRCVKLINVQSTDSFTDIYKTLRLLPFPLVYNFFTLIKFFKYFIVKSDQYFFNRISSVQTVHNLDTRFKSLLLLTGPRFTKSLSFNSFFYQSINLWNRLPLNIRCCDSSDTFKRLLRQSLEL